MLLYTTAVGEGKKICESPLSEDVFQEILVFCLFWTAPPIPAPDSPKNITSVAYDDAVIPCKMTGNPKPRIRWFKNNRPLSVNRGKYRQLPDGSLLIRSVRAMDSGRYMCVGENGVGVKSNSVDLVVPSKFEYLQFPAERKNDKLTSI